MKGWYRGLVALVLCVSASPALAQEEQAPTRRVEVRVTAVSGDSLYLDRGREEHLEPGDVVRLFPLGQPVVQGIVRAVSRNSARVELDGTGDGIEAGITGLVLVPEDRFDAPGKAEDEPTPADPPPPDAREVDHPPWEQPPEDWDQSVPLLAPVQARTPDERDSRIRGRLFTQADYTWDDANGERNYFLSRSGFDLNFDNPFGRAGQLEFDAEYFYRSVDTDDEGEDTDSKLRLDRLSYRWGGFEGRPQSWEVGRFLQHEFPEFGVLDGAEFIQRLPSGSRWGVSLGYLPEPDDRFETGEDLQAALFYRFVSGADERFSWGTGVQKTWHEGEADRDLLVSTLSFHPGPRTNVYAAAWLDYYTSSDEIKSSGFELTQFVFNTNHRFEAGHSLGLSASHIRWPELLRHEFQGLTPEQIEDNRSSRVGLNGTLRLSDHATLRARVDGWEDQDDSGNTADLRFGLRDVLYARGEVSLSAFVSEGKFSDGRGLRLSADRRLERGFVALSWDTTNFEQEDFIGGQEDLLHHTLRASYDTALSPKWNLSLFLEERLGDEQDALTLGFLLQRRL